MWVMRIIRFGHLICCIDSQCFLPPAGCGKIILLFISRVSVDVAMFKSDHQL